MSSGGVTIRVITAPFLRFTMHGRIRNGRDARWMPLTAEQYNFVGEPARMFYLNASMFMIPVQGYHQ